MSLAEIEHELRQLTSWPLQIYCVDSRYAIFYYIVFRDPEGGRHKYKIPEYFFLYTDPAIIAGQLYEHYKLVLRGL